MTFKEFIEKYTGKEVDFDGYYGTQCMDLMHQYVYDVLEEKDKTLLAAPSAYEVFKNFRWENLFEKINNTPSGLPEEGDIMFWNTGVGKWGHVAMFVDGDLDSFNSFDANWPTGSLPKMINHTYKSVAGWLRYKGGDEVVEDKELEICLINLEAMENNKDEWKKKARTREEEIEKLVKEVGEKQEHAESLQKSMSEMNMQLTNMTQQYKQLQETEKSLREACRASEIQIKSLATDLVKANEVYDLLKDSTNADIAKLQLEIKECKVKLEEGISEYSRWELVKAIFGKYV